MKKEEAIKLIGLIITVIILSILSAIGITMVTSIVDTSFKAKFYTEMSHLDEQKKCQK